MKEQQEKLKEQQNELKKSLGVKEPIDFVSNLHKIWGDKDDDIDKSTPLNKKKYVKNIDSKLLKKFLLDQGKDKNDIMTVNEAANEIKKYLKDKEMFKDNLYYLDKDLKKIFA